MMGRGGESVGSGHVGARSRRGERGRGDCGGSGEGIARVRSPQGVCRRRLGWPGWPRGQLGRGPVGGVLFLNNFVILFYLLFLFILFCFCNFLLCLYFVLLKYNNSP